MLWQWDSITITQRAGPTSRQNTLKEHVFFFPIVLFVVLFQTEGRLINYFYDKQHINVLYFLYFFPCPGLNAE